MAASSHASSAAIVARLHASAASAGAARPTTTRSLPPLLDRRCANDEYPLSRSFGTSSSRWSTSSSSSSPSTAAVAARPRASGGMIRGRGSDGNVSTTISASLTRGVSRIYNGGGHRSDRRVVVAKDKGRRRVRERARSSQSQSPSFHEADGQDRSPPDDGYLAEGARRVDTTSSGSPSRRWWRSSTEPSSGGTRRPSSRRGWRWNSGPIGPIIAATTEDAIAGAVGMDGTVVGGGGVSQGDGRYSSTIEDDPLHRANRASSDGLASARRSMRLLRKCDRAGPPRESVADPPGP